MRLAHRLIRVVAVGLTLMAAGPRTASADDAAADFSPSANPHGPWSYGWATAPGGTFVRDEHYPSLGSLDFWKGGGESFIAHNGTPLRRAFGTGVYPPGALALHPGRQGQVAVVRWTAGRAGTVLVDVAFTRRDDVYPTTSDVHVARSGTEIFASQLDHVRRAARFRSEVSVRAGDVLDFSVGYGADRVWNGDTTGLDAWLRWAELPR